MITCIDAFKNLNISIQNGKPAISPCCISLPVLVENLDFDNSYLNSFRESFSQGVLPPGCFNCKTNEQEGYISRRMGSNQWYADHGLANNSVELVRVDYWTGNTCNLACVICGPQNSSMWQKELGIQKPSVINPSWKQLDLTALKAVHFNGGEPLLSKEHVQFLHAIPNKSQVYVNYNTNGTILPNQELQQLWAKFKLVQLDFSIDDVGNRFEYQRYPACWDDVVANLQWYIDFAPHNCMFAVNTTVGILNKHNLTNLDQWLAQHFKQSRFGDPIEHRKQNALGKFSLAANVKTVKHQLDILDQRRNTNWRTVFPELE
jgi:sulfatase maturation enzyme AslB (radical SAM superfamily)